MISHSSKTASEVSNVLDKFLSLGLERCLSRVEPWPHLHWIRARFWEIIFVDLHQFVTPALEVWHLFSLRGGNPHKYIHSQYTWTKKMNAKIFFVHRSKYHKSDYKFHHTDSYNHPWYLSCGLSSLGHSQVAENIRCLILIFWENNFAIEKATDRWSDNFASSLFWYILSPVWLVGVCDDWKNNFTMAQSEVFTKVFQEKMSSVDPGFLPGPETLNLLRLLSRSCLCLFSYLLLMWSADCTALESTKLCCSVLDSHLLRAQGTKHISPN